MGPSLNERNETGAPSSDVISVRPLDAPVPTAPPLSPAPPPARASAPAAGAASAAKAVSAPPSTVTEQSKADVRENAAELPKRGENQPADVGSLGKVEGVAKPAAQPQAFPEAAKTAPAKQKRASEMDAVERRQTMAAGAWQNLHDRDEQAGKDAKLEDKAAAQAVAPVAAPAGAAAQASGGFAPAQSESTPAAAPPPPAEPMPRSKAAPATSAAPPPMLQSAPAAPPPAERALARPEAPLREESPAVRDDAAGAAPAQGQRMRSTDPNARLYPEHWLANIRTMLKENRRDEALRSLGEFRRMYPDYHLPDDLRDLK